MDRCKAGLHQRWREDCIGFDRALHWSSQWVQLWSLSTEAQLTVGSGDQLNRMERLLSAADHLRRETSKTYCVWVKISFCLFVLRYKLIISFCRRYWDSINIKEFNNAMQTQGWRHDKGLPAARYLPSLFHTLYPFVHCMLHTFVDAFSLTS